MSDLIRSLASIQKTPYAPPRPAPIPSRLPDSDRESAENLWAVNAGMDGPAPQPPLPYPPSDGHDYTQNFGEQVAPSADLGVNVPAGQYRSPFDGAFGFQKAPPVNQGGYVGQYRGRH